LLGIGGKLWDSTYVLLEYLGLHWKTLVEDKRIVELGCGTGLAGKIISGREC
jgi:predicted TPR repeat methyltransferase